MYMTPTSDIIISMNVIHVLFIKSKNNNLKRRTQRLLEII
jgi:hypothetical protein